MKNKKFVTRNYYLESKDINYLLSIVNEDILDEEKAFKLYSFCSYNALMTSVDFYKINEDFKIEYDKLIKIKELYDKYNEMGISYRNTFKCGFEELINKINDINFIYDVFKEENKDYSKLEKVFEIIPSSDKLEKRYNLLLKYYKNDIRLDGARKALDNFDFILGEYIKYEKSGIVDNILYVLKLKKYLDIYSDAEKIVNAYINYSGYKRNVFMNKVDIDKERFESYVDSIKVINPNLYKLYIDKTVHDNKLMYLANVNLLNSMADEIKENDFEYDLLEFIKKIPFKNSASFANTLKSFMIEKKVNGNYFIMAYVYKNKLNYKNVFKPINYEELYNSKRIINGREFGVEDYNKVIDYLKENDIPLVNKAFEVAFRRYANDELVLEKKL